MLPEQLYRVGVAMTCIVEGRGNMIVERSPLLSIIHATAIAQCCDLTGWITRDAVSTIISLLCH